MIHITIWWEKSQELHESRRTHPEHRGGTEYAIVSVSKVRTQKSNTSRSYTSFQGVCLEKQRRYESCQIVPAPRVDRASIVRVYK